MSSLCKALLYYPLPDALMTYLYHLSALKDFTAGKPLSFSGSRLKRNLDIEIMAVAIPLLYLSTPPVRFINLGGITSQLRDQKGHGH